MTTEPTTPAGYDDANAYTRIIVDEALRRGIDVTILDAALGELVLRHGDVEHHAFQSLSDLTSAIAFRRCDDKVLTRRVLAQAGLPVAPGLVAGDADRDRAFLAEHGRVVVKPAAGEGGAGITVGVTTTEGLDAAMAEAAAVCPRVVLEAVVDGDDLRVLVIAGAVVAAAVRRPPEVEGDGASTIRSLIEARNRELAETSGGTFRIPLDEGTTATVRAAGHDLDDVLDAGAVLAVRGTANLHAGGTIHDVTAELHPDLAATALAATAALDLPVAGVDLMVDDPVSPTSFAVIEVNEQPGLANHEPNPTAERYLDLLFPETAATS